MNEELKKRNLYDHPQYFGAFLNMARLNILSISNHLAKISGKKELDDEEKIKSSFLCDNNLNWNKVIGMVKKFIPIVKIVNHETRPLSEKNKLKEENKYNKPNESEIRYDFLLKLITEISDFRDDYTHYYSIKNKTERKKIISPEIAVFLTENFDRAIEYTKERFTNVFYDDDFELVKKIKLVESNYEITSLGLVFLTSLFLEREYAFLFIGKVPGLKGTQNKSFLAAREVFMAFCVKLPHDKFVSQDRKQELSLLIVNELNKCPKLLYNVITENDKKQFLPDLDITARANMLENSVPDDEMDFDSYIQNISKKIRYENRFPYFALRYIDETEMFTKFRFQINLGKILLNEYKKKLLNVEQDRQIFDDAFAFGKLNSFLNNEIETLNKIKTSDSDIKFEQFAPHYNFDEKLFKIGISEDCENPNKTKKGYPVFIKKDNKANGVLKQQLPEAFFSLNCLNDIVLLDYLKKGEREKPIKEFIQLNKTHILNWEFIEKIKLEFTDLNVFQKYSKSKKQKGGAYKKEHLIELKNRKKRLNDVLEKHNLNYKQIPSRIVEYWLNINDTNYYRQISDRIKLMKTDGKQRLKDLKKDKAPKVGEMASFLAKDIVNMMISKESKEKVTSFYYDKMQECLALYNVAEKRQMFLDICKMPEFNLFDTQKGHPFLAKINLEHIKYTTDFYKAYIEEKTCKMVETVNYKTGKQSKKDQSWMANTFYKFDTKKQLTVVKLPELISNLPVTIKNWLKDRYDIKEWFDHINGKIDNIKCAKKPVDLPTNLFELEIKTQLQNSLTENQIPFNESDTNNHLFKLWWIKVKNNGFQKFYNATREYCIYDEKVNFEIKPQGKFNDYYKQALYNAYTKLSTEREIERKTKKALPQIEKKQVEKIFKHTIGTTEKEIRILQEQDALMLMMFENLLEKPGINMLNHVDMENILNQSIDVKIPITGKLSFNNDGELIKTNDNKLAISKTLVEKRKRKEFSVIHKYMHDKRLPELFQYFDCSEISVSAIKIELDTYNKVKSNVFDLVFEFENKLIEKDIEGIKSKIENPKEHIQHEPFLLWLKSENYIDENEFRFLKMVRNTFSHNQFPQKKTMEIFVKQWKNNKFVEQIFEIYNQKIEAVLAKLS